MPRSKFESEIIKKLGDKYKYEPFKLPYVAESEYIPDLVRDGHDNILIEIKGRFRTTDEATKYVNIRKCNPDKEIVFIFMKPDNKMPRARKRKDGTIYTMAEWADKHGFKYFSPDNLEELEKLYD